MPDEYMKAPSITKREHEAPSSAKRVVTKSATGRTVSYEDTSFVTGDSPIVLDINTDLGKSGDGGYVTNDGLGNIKVEISDNGTNYGGVHTLKTGETMSLNGMFISKIRLTWVSDSSYRVLVGNNASLDKIPDVEPETDYEGAPVPVGTTEVEMIFSGTTKSIMIQSDPDNTGIIWVGKSNITNAGANAMVQLSPGQSVSINLDDSSNAIYAVSDTASQNVFKMALV